MEGSNRVNSLRRKTFLGSAIVVLAILSIVAGIIVHLASSSPALSAGSTYYVAPTGNDSNPGTQAQPFRTIGRAAALVQPGSTVYIRAGTYREQVTASTSGAVNNSITFRNYGSEAIVLDGECSRGHGFLITGSWIIVQGLTIKRTVEASILIDGIDPPRPSNVTITGMTLQDFDCTWSSQDPADWGQFRGGVAAWYPGSGIRVTNNAIRHRTSGEVRGSADGVWFKSNDNNPSGGGHYVAGNTIIGGWDGIGGEEEGSAHGTFDRDTIVENNTVQNTWDDCIQVEGGDQNVRIRNNDLSGCGTGIAFAAPMSGPLYLENNTIHDLVTGLYANHVCYKTGTNAQSSAVTYMTGNSCDVHGGEENNGIHQSGGDNMTPIVSRNNRYSVDGYVYYLGHAGVAQGTDFDQDCMYTTNENFAKWNNVYYETFAAFQAGTGQERNGQQSEDCSTPPAHTPTPVPSQTPSATPWPSPSPSPAGSATPPSATPWATSTPEESPLISAAMAAGWNYDCYVGSSRPVEEALAVAGKISAVYRLGEGEVFDRWFPDRPDFSTLTTVNPGDALFSLASDSFVWTQSVSVTGSTVELHQGWNSVCYLGSSGPAEAATAGIDVAYGVFYTLAPDQTWRLFAPFQPEASSLSELARFTPVLILVTGGSGHWAFNP